MSAKEIALRGVQYSCLFVAAVLGAYAAWAFHLWTTGSANFVLSLSAGAVLFAFVGGLVWLTGRHSSYGGGQSTRDISKGW